jgi:hypothetical protein
MNNSLRVPGVEENLEVQYVRYSTSTSSQVSKKNNSLRVPCVTEIVRKRFLIFFLTSKLVTFTLLTPHSTLKTSLSVQPPQQRPVVDKELELVD